MTIDMEQFRITYIAESLEGLERMEANLLNLQFGSEDPDTINTIFRTIHSIKGGGATFGFSEISDFTHVVETLLDQIRNGERNITAEAINLFLQSVDCLRDMLVAVQNHGQTDEPRIGKVKQQLDLLLKDGKQASSIREEIKKPTNSAAKSRSIKWKIRFKPFPNILATGNDVVRMFRELDELGEFHATVDFDNLPSLSDLVADDCYLSWEATLTGKCSRQAIQDVFAWVEDECDLEIAAPRTSGNNERRENKKRINKRSKSANTVAEDSTAMSAKSSQSDSIPDKAGTAAPGHRSGGGPENSSIRVDIEKVDSLINMVGELVITQSMLSQLGDEFDLSRLEKLRNGLGQLERNTRELQERVMRIRMIPIGFAFNRFPRLIHDMCNKLGKKVQLKLSGEATELDKTVMEKIVDPLVHLVRNAMDHGIETPEARVAAGKPPTGTLHLNAFHQGGNIVIEISDDGAGVDPQKVFAKAIERGLVEDGAELAQGKIIDLLFQPGFSTAEKVTDVSGRGVGMDVVRKNIQELGGTVDVQSTPGKGSVFTVRLPLTLAILDGQLVRVGGNTYTIPLVSIVESLQVQKKFVNAIAGKTELYKLRDEYIPVIKLYEAFSIEPDSKNLENGLLVVVEGDGKKAGLLVDDLLAQQQVVIKSLETNFRRVHGVSGATILGDGTVALILDVAGVIRVYQKSYSDLNSVNESGEAA